MLSDVGVSAVGHDEGAARSARPAIAVGIATAGRPAVVFQTVRELRLQTRIPNAVFVCAPTQDDVAGLAEACPEARILIGPRGSCHQRNKILQQTARFDILLFVDDDFLPCPRYVEAIERVFVARPDIVMTTGRVLADGISGPGLDFATARRLIGAAAPEPGDPLDVEDTYNAYGCNMAVRLQPVREHGLVFDEELPLYAWLEDVDFSRRLAAHGRIVKAAAARGIHLGVKSGRQSGRRLGYSQVANPIYLAAKGTFSWRRALVLMARNMAANALGCINPEPYIDRFGRAAGNGRALADLFTGRLRPSRALSLWDGA